MMPDVDGRIRETVEHLARSAPPAPPLERIGSRRARLRLVHRLQISAMVAVVIVGTVAGTYGLSKVFRGPGAGRRPAAQGPLAGNGKIAFLSDRDVGPEGTATGEAASPGGAGQPVTGHVALYAVNANGSRVTRLTNEAISSSSLAWSPDGATIAFTRAVTEGEGEIDVVNADGTGQRVLARLPQPYQVAWSPDGSRMAYSAGSASIYAMRSDGTGMSQLTEPPSLCGDEAPAWSPDGSRIAFRRFCNEQDSGIYSIDTDGSGLTKLASTQLRDSGPAWSPDGAKIAFGSAGQIQVMNADGTGRTSLTSDGENFFPVWSPDGTKIAFTSDRDGNREIYVMKADGSDQTNITRDPADDFAPAWQPVPASASSNLPVSPSPSVSIAPQECAARESSAVGDFDGDGTPETASVAPSYCFEQRTQKDSPWTLSIDFGSAGVEVGEWSMRECAKDACRILGAGDLNGDGLDELAVMVEEGASTSLVEFFPIHLDAIGPTPVVADPSLGSMDFPAGETVRFPFGGSVTHFAALGCDGSQVISETATLSEDQTEWAVRRTVLRFDPGTDANGHSPRFEVVSTEDSSQAFDPDVGVGDIFEPGGPCWMESGLG